MSNIIVKLVSEDYYEDFMKNGDLFFGDSNRYRKIETEEHNKWIGDKNDSHISYSKQELSKYKINLITNDKKQIEIPIDDFVEIEGEALGYSVNVSIFCTVILRRNDLKNSYTKKKFINDIKNTLLSDKRYKKKIIVITNPQKFFERIRKAAIENNYDIHGKEVKYIKNQQSLIKKLLFSKKETKFSELHDYITFSKDSIFIPEREFRMAIFRKNERNSISIRPCPENKKEIKHEYKDIILSIGPMDDISIKFDSIEDLMKSLNLSKL